MKSPRLWMVVGLAGVAATSMLQRGEAEADEGPVIGGSTAHRLSHTRQLRRIFLVLRGRAPTPDEYAALLAVPPEDRDAYLADEVDAALDSDDFADVVLRWGLETMRVQSYDYRFDFVNNWFRGDYGLALQSCADGTLHAGAVGFLNNLPNWGEPLSMCDDPDAPLVDIEPWWAPGTTVPVIGAAGSGVREVDGVDCGTTLDNGPDYRWPATGCSCGPNLIYCQRRGIADESNKAPESVRRQAFEEPARLYRHVILEDRPLSDLVLGDYTVVTRGLFNLYRRAARRNGDNAALDDDPWFYDFDDDAQWREVAFHVMHPDLLADRDYAFDPRTESGSPEGIPSAGVLSTLGVGYAFPRERVRAARFIETFACREFSPPPADVEFEPFVSDPGTQGSCEHCHQLIDPAAMYFKRTHGGGAEIGGVGAWDFDSLDVDNAFRERSLSTFEADTLMTPVDALTIEENPDAALIDFMPEDYTLFGTKSDGTIGPLGFGKILVESGEFDRCAVRRFHERITGVELVPGRDDARIDALVEAFVADGRSTRSLIKRLMAGADFAIGW